MTSLLPQNYFMLYNREVIIEHKLLKELDKGIDDMEAGRFVLHEKAMRIIFERTKSV